MNQIASSEGRKIIRMGPKAFLELCDILKREGDLQPTQWVTLIRGSSCQNTLHSNT